ncbi:FkbM family methyltransferase [Candidatus Pelagibacter sp.]|jgi:FkbM family methyltransferase|nr:FkbM family methyltransferase [Candidatus Pelagibacter sp.]
MKIEERLKEKYLYKKGFNFFKIFYFIYQYFKTRKILKQKTFYSNWGLDMLADDFFKKKEYGIYIDIGCHQPFLNNNTYRLYKRGWTGINIDLDFNSIDLFNFFRKKDFNVNAAISDKNEDTDLYFFHNRSAINTLSKETGAKAKEIRKIRTRTLNDIIENSPYKNQKINYLSIDVEGHEMNVLNGFDINKYKPELVVLEFIDIKIKEYYMNKIDNIISSEIYNFMTKHNYKLINWVHDDLVFVPKSTN